MVTPINILIVEDSEDDAQLLLDELHTGGFEPTWKRVENKSDFLANLGAKVDLVFSDFNMPLFSAARALELLQNSKLAIPFIIVSGTIGEERAVECLKAGATDYVLKDRINRLVPATRRALRETRERREHAEAEKNLVNVRKQLDHVLAHSPAVIYSLKIEGDKFVPIWVSENINQFLGRVEGGETGRTRWLNSVHPEDRGEALGGETRALLNGHSVKEYRLKHRDGQYRWVRDEQRLLLDAQGRPVEVVGSWIDITAQKNLEEQFLQAQKMESIGQLAGGVAHDFNNILTVIQGHASLLMDEPPVRALAAESLEIIAHAADRAAQLTRQLLMFSRKQLIQSQLLDLNQVVGNLTKMLKRVLGADVSLRAIYDSNLSLVKADAGMMEQVLMNLAVNARDAMPNGGELVISTSDESISPEYVQTNPQAAMGDHVCLAVSDTGCGIPREILSRVFEPFFTTKEVGKGTGLGLATVYGIVKQHHGWVTIYSEVDKGSVFRIYLPVAQDSPKKKVEEPEEEAVPPGTETVLLVEDEPAVRLLARKYLQKYGYTILEAETGVAALRIWETERDRIDLVLTDMIMPGGVSGRDLVKKILMEKPKMPVIYMSGYSADVIGKDFELSHDINFMQKPFPPRKFAQMVRKVLDRERGLPK